MKFQFKKLAQLTGREMFCLGRLRCEVFVTEQGITLPELDDADLAAVQVFCLNQEQTDALATCRLFQANGRWLLGRVAVAKAARRQHLGSQMLAAVHSFLAKRGVSALYCHAQMPVVPFYQQLGYQISGQPFDEGGVMHVMMRKNLK